MPSICSKQLSPGDVVFECKPLIHVLRNEFKGEYCDNCLQRSDSLKRCAKCLQMFYCDRNCQTFDWIQHKNECKLFRLEVHLFGEELDLYRIFRRLMLCIKNDKTFATKRHQLIDGSDVCLNDIEVNVKELLKNKDSIKAYNSYENLYLSYGFDRKELLHWFGVFHKKCSVRQLTDYSKEITTKYCFGLYIETCRISHSCLPNTAIVNNGLTLQVRAMKAIASGEELTVCYIDLNQNKTERQTKLKEFSIDCKCLKCEQSLDSGAEDKVQSRMSSVRLGKESISEFISFLTVKFGQHSPEKTITLYRMALGNLKLPPILPNPMHQMFTEEILKELKEAIPITHGITHPLATRLAELIGEDMNPSTSQII